MWTVILGRERATAPVLAEGPLQGEGRELEEELRSAPRSAGWELSEIFSVCHVAPSRANGDCCSCPTSTRLL